MKFGRFRISQVMAVTLGALAAIALAIALFNAVGGGGDRSAPADGVRCAPALAAARRIEGGLTVDGGGSLSNAQAVRSGDFDSVWFVAAEIDGPGLEERGEIGVWATNDLTDGLIFAVDSLAKEFSDWGDGDSTAAQFSMANDGAEQARDCLDG